MLQLPYVKPYGLPLYWKDDTSGLLKEAVQAFYEQRETAAQRVLVREYLVYVLKAPCWQLPSEERQAMLDALTAAQSNHAIDDVIEQAMKYGIDPL